MVLLRTGGQVNRNPPLVRRRISRVEISNHEKEAHARHRNNNSIHTPVPDLVHKACRVHARYSILKQKNAPEAILPGEARGGEGSRADAQNKGFRKGSREW